MKYYRMLRNKDKPYVDEVDGKRCKYCVTAFTYKSENKVYHLVDIDTGLSICYSKKLKDLESVYNTKKEAYEIVRKNPKYKIRIEEFERLKVSYQMKGGQQ